MGINVFRDQPCWLWQVDMNDDYHTHISALPSEVLLEVFASLDATSLCQACLTCKQWYNIISESQTLWKLQCLKITDDEVKSHLLKTRNVGQSWKEAFKKNYGKSYIKQKWKEGRFSKPTSFSDLPKRVICPMDASTWGEIFQMELER
ncbi:F-box only protein 48-like [Gigantopelta aegis]|uniref:F-box only protein 48-like n=1 Tax=Gigantopelta aegis TaxID=1735272 RepID=UPI001B88B730|nr:F-box only protein 48-like [Gigantopelta aegis]